MDYLNMKLQEDGKEYDITFFFPQSFKNMAWTSVHHVFAVKTF